MAKLGAAADANEPVLAQPQLRGEQLRHAAARPPGVLALGAAGDQVAGQGIGHRQGRGPGGQPHDRRPQPVRQAHPGAGTEPVDRAARPRQPQPRGRARPAQPRRQGLHRAGGAAAVRLHPAAGDQHVRRRSATCSPSTRSSSSTCSPYATPRRSPTTIKQQGVAAARSVLLGARSQPAGRDHDRPDQPERVRARSGRRPSGEKGTATSACKLQASASAASPRNAAAPTATPARARTLAQPARRPPRAARPARAAEAVHRRARPPTPRPASRARSVRSRQPSVAASSSGEYLAHRRPSSASSGGQTQQLLNYLLAP